MILNAKNNAFVFTLPKGFISDKLEDKYSFYLKRLPTPFDTISTYLSHTIQSVTFPQVSATPVEQTLDKVPQFYRQSFDIERLISKEFTVNFKLADGYLNYWILFEQFMENMQMTKKTPEYSPDMNLRFLDRDGYQLVSVNFVQPFILNIDSIDMSYASVGYEFKTFGMTFKYNQFKINVDLD